MGRIVSEGEGVGPRPRAACVRMTKLDVGNEAQLLGSMDQPRAILQPGS